MAMNLASRLAEIHEALKAEDAFQPSDGRYPRQLRCDPLQRELRRMLQEGSADPNTMKSSSIGATNMPACIAMEQQRRVHRRSSRC